MKRTKFTIACLIAVGALAFASCTKKKSDDTVHNNLSAKWKTYKTGFDMDRDGVMDADEVDTTSDGTNITFSSDGTGKSENTAASYSSTFTWTLKNNNTDIALKETSGSTSGSQTTMHIEALSSTDLNLSGVDSATSIKTWIFLKKQ